MMVYTPCPGPCALVPTRRSLPFWTALDPRSPLTSNGADSSNSELKTVEVGFDWPATDHDIQPSIQFEGVHLMIAVL